MNWTDVALDKTSFISTPCQLPFQSLLTTNYLSSVSNILVQLNLL